jgi:deoxyadenosine/deoxycytidine kinase
MACLKGAHSEVSASQALMKLLQRFIENTENWSVNIKVFIILHRCLQDFDLSQAVAQELSEKSDILTHYKKKPNDSTYGKLYRIVGHFTLVQEVFCSFRHFSLW